MTDRTTVPAVRVERKGTTVVWTIDRPAAKNALDLATLAELTRAIREERAARVAIVTGTGDVFISGGDLRELRSKSTRADAETLTDAGFALTSAIATARFPVIAAINGAAIGGGAELLVACDLRIAAPSARITFKHVRMGVTPSWGTMDRLMALVGAGTAARLLLAAQDIPASDALALGLVDATGDLATALEWADDIARGAPSAVAAMKTLLRARTGDTRAQERASFVETWSGEDHAEAMTAWFERRPPAWKLR